MTYLYRVLREDECLTWETNGLVAKDPDAKFTVEDHVTRGSQPEFASKFISTCKTLSAARTYASSKFIKTTTIVAMDLREVNVSKRDISTHNNASQYIKTDWAINFAAKYEEILIVGAIPASCISLQTTIEINTFCVYRLLREDEHSTWKTTGLIAKDPDAEISVEKHVSTGSQRQFTSQFISTSRSLQAAVSLATLSYTRPRIIVGIDIVKVTQRSNVKIIDISTNDNVRGYITNQWTSAIDYATRFEEILIVGAIPETCITKCYKFLNDRGEVL